MSAIPSTQPTDYTSMYTQLEKNAVDDYSKEANQAEQETKQMEDKMWQQYSYT
jgi:hypothetical protein